MTLPNVIEFCCVTLVYYELWYITKHRHTQFLCLIYYLCSSAVRWWVSAHLPWSWFSCYRTMVNCRAFDKVGCQIGVGKESGIFPYPVMQILFLYYSNVGCQIRVWKTLFSCSKCSGLWYALRDYVTCPRSPSVSVSF